MTRIRFQRVASVACLLAVILGGHRTTTAADPDPEALQFFEKRIRPVLAEKCYRCHSSEAEKLKAGLQVDHIEHLLEGGDTGPAIVPGNPDESFLVETLRYGDPDFQMPPKGKLDDAVIADFEKWVAMGAPWPQETVPEWSVTGVKVDGSDAIMEAFDLEKRRSEHWSWQPITAPEFPAVRQDDWPARDLDHFVLAGLEKADLVPAEAAAPEIWLRRVTFDLVGLPPTPDEITEFLRQKETVPGDSDVAEQAVVDRLLASPQFGERWARHWMDLARFAETCGHEFDYPIPHAWRYRDYLIDAYNLDLPYDQFLVEHLAGDLLDEPRLDADTGTNASVVGTGFWFLHEAVHAPTDIRGDEADRVDNQIDVFSKSFLGLTVACARCHDHKFDAISTADYYAMAGYLQSSRRQEVFLDPHAGIAKASEQADAIRQDGQTALATAFGTPAENDDAAREFSRYLLAASALLEAHATSPGERAEGIFEDFESGYGDWQIEGEAFGRAPAKGAFAGNQKLEGFLGKGLVNTWIRSDKLTGRARSPEFVIETSYLHFLIAGGKHPGKTCVNLVIDGKVVETATGENSDHLKPHTWKLDAYRGENARLEIVDEATGGWGHIDVDHFVFSDRERPVFDPTSRDISPDLVKRIAAQHGSLDEGTLLRWAELLQNEVLDSADHPLHAWKHPEKAAELARRAKEMGHRFAEAISRTTLLSDFQKGEAEGWTSTGNSFATRPTTSAAWSPGNARTLVTPSGAMTSDFVDARFDGVLRSPTFELTHSHLHLRMKSKAAKVRLVIDGHYMNHFHQLLLKGTLLKSNATESEDEFRWFTMTGNLDKYLGHRVWIEISDLEGGSVVLDEVRLSNERLPPEPEPVMAEFPSDLPAKATPADVANILGDDWAQALSALPKGNPTPGQVALLNLAWDHRLWPRISPRLVSAEAQMKALKVPKAEFAVALLDGTPEDERVHIRGSHQKLGEAVPRRNLDALGGTAAPRDSSGRLELARELVTEANPLVRRVAVNRIWHQLFGRGLVPTVDDFGVMGQAPSHPELLDHLASDFSGKHGWSTKSLLREIVLSQTYRMSSTPHPSTDLELLAEIDPENLLLHKAPVRRLQAEAVRDAILTVSGRLDPSVGGASVPIHLTAFMEGRGRPGRNGPLDGDGRRSVYTEIRRNFLPPFLLTFDMPIPFNAMGRRSVSNVPAQALALMNDPFVMEQAERWATRVRQSDAANDEAKITTLFLGAFARPPSAAELGQIEAFLASESDESQAWIDLCHALLNKKEFIYLN